MAKISEYVLKPFIGSLTLIPTRVSNVHPGFMATFHFIVQRAASNS